jgi:hypothetical protein
LINTDGSALAYTRSVTPFCQSRLGIEAHDKATPVATSA